ncbi:MAG: TIGR03663 family protein [Sedimentisphaerales bacterium]|nr:TIGR03663 family protein [Sedimentisphaerales bacterium]
MRWLDWAPCDRRLRLFWLMIFVVALGALALRAPRLRMRPMHTDEAVHAYNFRGLLENGIYRYDPEEYHGPTLNYFTLIPAWLSSARTYTEITESTVRIVPVAFGVAVVLLTVLLVDGLGPVAVVAAVLTALSAAMVFYSRYYIQEMLLVCFTFGVITCGYRYARSRRLHWAVLTGVFAGLMHATKETAVIAFGSMGLALVVLAVLNRRRGRSTRQSLAGVKSSHLILGIAAAVAVSALFYSAFLRHPRGVLDSYLTYATYLGRAGGQNTAHLHPWYYYLQMLLLSRYEHGPIWTEGGIVLLALVGVVAAVKGSRLGRIDPKLMRFLAIYTVTMTVVYSAVPYKTPWCLLSFLHGMILLAGAGAFALLTWAQRPAIRLVVIILLVVGAGHLAFEMYRANFIYYADSRNPYVYAHPTREIFLAVDKVREYADRDGVGHSEDWPIQVIVPGGDYWPLPWYLRDLQVGYYPDVPEPNEIGPLILISDKLEGTLAGRLYSEMPADKRQMYMYLFDDPYYIWARPQVKLMGFVRKDLWERHNYRPVPQ